MTIVYLFIDLTGPKFELQTSSTQGTRVNCSAIEVVRYRFNIRGGQSQKN